MFLINNILTFFIFISCPQHFGETEDFAKKNNGETEDFGQKNFGVSEKWLATIDISISNSPYFYQI